MRTIRWIATEYWCPYCGERTMQQDPDSYDYYSGLTTQCTSCREVTYGLDEAPGKTAEAPKKAHWWDVA